MARQVVDTPASFREEAIPAVYKTESRLVVDVPASFREETIPAVFKTEARQIVDKAASVREELVPAVFKTEARQVVDRAAATREIEVPAVYETISTQVKVADGRVERRAVLCESNATATKIRELQTALKTAGFDPGSIDGRIKASMMTAVAAYQTSKRLPVDDGRVINIETVKALGVSPN